MTIIYPSGNIQQKVGMKKKNKKEEGGRGGEEGREGGERGGRGGGGVRDKSRLTKDADQERCLLSVECDSEERGKRGEAMPTMSTPIKGSRENAGRGALLL